MCGGVGGMMVIELLAGTMGRGRGRIAAVGCSSMGAGSIGGKKYCGNLLWQSSLTLLPPLKFRCPAVSWRREFSLEGRRENCNGE